MTWEEAIKYCEEHKCKDCPAFHNDCRTIYKKEYLYYPCLINLVDKELRKEIENG